MIYFSKKKQIPYDIQCVPDGVSFIQSSLEECGSERKSIIRMLLLTEELLVKLIGSQTKESEGSVWIQVTSIFGETRIRIWGKGEKLEAEVETKIEAYIDGIWGEIPFAVKENIGRTVDYVMGRNRYIGYLISLATRSFKGVRVIIAPAKVKHITPKIIIV